MRRTLVQVETSDGRAENASEGGKFVDIIGSLEYETGCESKGMTFAATCRFIVRNCAERCGRYS